MSTQLRLVEVLPPAPRTGSARIGNARTGNARTGNARTGNEPRQRSAEPPRKAKRTVAPARRSVNWGDWRLDTRTRSVGRAGVAAARRALEEAATSGQLSEAS